MNDFEKEEKKVLAEQKAIRDKSTTIFFFFMYMISTLMVSFLLSSGKDSGYVFGMLFGTTIAMFIFIPNMESKDKNYLIANAVFFTMYPTFYSSYTFKILMILNYCLFSLKFTMFITRTYLKQEEESV